MRIAGVSQIDIPVHPAADLFPMLDEDALTGLENDIKLNGQHQPILTWRGAIVDGRNRYAACISGGVKPKLKEVSFADEGECVRFIVSTNIHRRHLTTSQRAVIAAELANLGHGQRQDQSGKFAALTQEQAAEQMQVSERAVREAKMVQRDAPDLAAKVKAGEIKVSRAAAMAKERTKPQTDPDQAADSVIDATAARHAEGDTARSRNALATLAKLDDTELSFIRPDVLRMLGVA